MERSIFLLSFFHNKEDTRVDIYFRKIMLTVLKTNNGSNKNNKMYLRNQCYLKNEVHSNRIEMENVKTGKELEFEERKPRNLGTCMGK